MKRILIFAMLLCVSVFLFAKKTETAVLLAELDKAIVESEKYVQEKEQNITKLQQQLEIENITTVQQYDICSKLSQQFKSYKLDSAIVYTKKCIQIARKTGNDAWLYDSQLNLTVLFSLTALYVEAMDLLRQIPVEKLSEGLTIKYFDAYVHFYDYYSHESDSYKNNYVFLRDTLLNLYDKNAVGYKLLYAEKLIADGELENARTYLLKMLENQQETDRLTAIWAYYLGYSYVQDKNLEMQIKYFAMSAIADMKNAIKENTSLRALSLALYQKGDIKLAYKYIQKSMEDAIFCKAHLRTAEVSHIFSIIENAHYQQNEQQRKILLILFISISVLALFFVLAVIFLYILMKKKSKSRIELAKLAVNMKKTNRDLTETNKKMRESNVVKEEYIARYMNQASAYLEKLEDYRRSLNRIAMNGKLEELYKALKSQQFLEDEIHEFYVNFDKSFLQLFPNFVEDFNALLAPEERIAPKPKELLNTELRIFALIRLGITDSNKIASFLRYPVRTIYNYRTKVRNKAAGTRDIFEDNVMKIGILEHEPHSATKA